MTKQEEPEYTQQEFEVLDRILSGFIHKKERVFVIQEIFKEGYRKRSQELVLDTSVGNIDKVYKFLNQTYKEWAGHTGDWHYYLSGKICSKFGTNVGGVKK